MAQHVNNLPVTQEIWIWSLGREDPLEKGMPTHSSILAWRIRWTEEPDRLQTYIVAKETTDKELIYKIYKQLIQLNECFPCGSAGK